MGLIIDSFAGGGGASVGIQLALGRSPDIAINHNPEAVAMHKANHPATRHYIEDIWQVDPIEATGGQPVDLMWASPDCTHHSKAKGGKPCSPRIRGLAWSVEIWAKKVRPRVICLENVEEFQDWGPVDKFGKPIKALAGTTFDIFVNSLRQLGYEVDYRDLIACDYGVPTSRKRLFLIARCDGEPIVWPARTHGLGTSRPYHTAAECIDWTLPVPSIFSREKELVEATKRRIARGVVKYVINSSHPYIVKNKAVCMITYHSEQHRGQVRGQALNVPVNTVDASNRYGLVSAFLTKFHNNSTGLELTQPMPTITAGGQSKRPAGSPHALGLVACTLMRQFGTSNAAPIDAPVGTIMPEGGGKTGLIAAFLDKYYGSELCGSSLDSPIGTIRARDCFGLVLVHVDGDVYAISDIGLRMLQPRELFDAQGFPHNYIIDPVFNGKPFPKNLQVKMCGNAVCPPLAAALVKANCQFMLHEQAVA